MGQKRRYEEFMESMKSLLVTGKHSDFIVTCGEDTYNVHKSIVCSQCDFLDAASRFGKEGEEGKIDLVDDEPEIVKYLIHYLYELDYHAPSEGVRGPWMFRLDWKSINLLEDPNWRSAEHRWKWDYALWKISATKMSDILNSYDHLKPDESCKVFELKPLDREHRKVAKDLIRAWKDPVHQNTIEALPDPPCAEDLSIHAEVYAIAEKYNVKGLKELAREKFTESLNYACTNAKFFEVVDIVYTTTPETDHDLRKLVARHLHRQKELYGLHSLLKTALKTTPDLAYHMLRFEYAQLEEPSRSSLAPSGQAGGRSQNDSMIWPA